MSDLTSLLRACIDQAATGVFRSIHPNHVLEEERASYDFIRNFFQRHGQLPSISTVAGAGILLQPVVEPASYYLVRVRERFAYLSISDNYRGIHSAMQRRDVSTAVSLMRECVNRASSAVSPQTYSSIGDVADMVRQEFIDARANLGILRGITLGYDSMNWLLGGARGGDIIVVAGRPGMGKSYVLLEMADKAWLSGRAVAFVTMEMSTQEMGVRWASIHTGINPESISRGELDVWAESILMDALSAMQDRGATTPLRFLAGDFNKDVKGIEDFILEHSPDIVFIDAAYLLTASGKTNGYISKWENISAVIGELKTLTIRYNIPIVISVQFNRNVKNAQQTELDLSDVAGSDSIPQDATAVFGLRKGLPPFESTRRFVQILKSRRGNASDFQINFNFSPVNFSQCSEDDLAEVDVSYMLGWLIAFILPFLSYATNT